jgi:hypothetical protein
MPGLGSRFAFHGSAERKLGQRPNFRRANPPRARHLGATAQFLSATKTPYERTGLNVSRNANNSPARHHEQKNAQYRRTP